MIEKVSKEKHDKLVKKVELIKKTITDWKEILAATKELEYLVLNLSHMLEIMEEIDDIDKEEEAIDRVAKALEAIGIDFNDKLQEKFETDSEKEREFNDDESNRKTETNSEIEKSFKRKTRRIRKES